MKTKKTQTKASSTDRATQYALDVLGGKFVAGPHVRNACQRHLDDLEKGHERGLWFDHGAAERVYAYFENVLKLSEGQFEGQPFLLHPSQAFKLGSIFGWKKADGTRRFRRAYIEEGKGNGKSPLVGGIGLYGLASDGEPGAEIYPFAAKKETASILFRDAVKMVRKSPALSQRLRFSGGVGREYNIAHLKSGSFFRPVSRDTGKTGSGPRPHFALGDEIHELNDRMIIELLERGFKFRRNPLIVLITNSGSDRTSVCWEEHEWAIKVAAGSNDAVLDPAYVGEVLDDETFSYVCALDEDDDPLNDPSCWAKANPLLGVTITEEYLAGVVAQAKAIPGKLNTILRLHFCVWTDAARAWMPRSTVEPLFADFEPEEFKGKPIYVGADLSGTRDLTALGMLVEDGEFNGKPTYSAWCEIWTPGDTISERTLKDKVPYDVWAREGFLNAPSGASIRLDDVAAYIAGMSTQFEVTGIAYDRYAYRKLQEELEDIGVELTHFEHPQGGIKKGKVENGLEEGLWMPGSVKEIERLILEKRLRIRRNPAVMMAIMSAITEEDRWNNYWLSKRKAVNKIDPVIALTMAVGLATQTVSKAENSTYETEDVLFI